MAHPGLAYFGGCATAPDRGRRPRTPGIFRFAPAAWYKSKVRMRGTPPDRSVAPRFVWSSAFRRVRESSGAAGSFPSDPRMHRLVGLSNPRKRGTPNRKTAWTLAIRATVAVMHPLHAIGPKRKMPGFGAEPQEVSWRNDITDSIENVGSLGR